ncbi:Uncharacterised protein [Vibrio cholerae]|nr:Uncharacterised protein [Vibrio cholerae]
MHNRTLGDPVFWSVVDGSFSNRQSTAHSRSGVAASKSA